jgi:hypothetical protein
MIVRYIQRHTMAAIDPMRGMISSYLASPTGKEMIRNYLSSPEGQKVICDYIATSEGKKTLKKILPCILNNLPLSPKIRALVMEKSESPI